MIQNESPARTHPCCCVCDSARQGESPKLTFHAGAHPKCSKPFVGGPLTLERQGLHVLSDDDDGETHSEKRVNSHHKPWAVFSGAWRPTAWKPRRACPWATGHARSRPRRHFERSLAQRVTSNGMPRIGLSEGKKALSAHVSGWHCLDRDCLKSH